MREKTYRIYTPLLMLALMNVIGFGLLAFENAAEADRIKTGVTALLFMLLLIVSYLLIRALHMGDGYLFLPVTALMSIGLMMLTRIDPSYGERQMLWFIVSVGVFFVSYFMYRAVKIKNKLFWLYAGASVALFTATLLFGRTIHGAKNWIYFGNQGFQPSELIRILYVLALSCLFGTGDGKLLSGSDTKKSMLITAYVYINLGFLVLQREWGIAVLFFIIYMAMYFVFGKKMSFLVINAAIAALGGYVGYKVLFHIQTRVKMWVDPFSDPTGRGYQIVQSLIAIASGGFTGVGLANGSPEYVPFVESDFIFSAVCEEFGILGGIGVILLFFIMVYRGFKIALAAKSSFDKRTAFGLSVMFGFQTFIILGGVVKLIPLTGITLPFISYGGSSLVTSFMALGILQAISVGEGDDIE